MVTTLEALRARGWKRCKACLSLIRAEPCIFCPRVQPGRVTSGPRIAAAAGERDSWTALQKIIQLSAPQPDLKS